MTGDPIGPHPAWQVIGKAWLDRFHAEESFRAVRVLEGPCESEGRPGWSGREDSGGRAVGPFRPQRGTLQSSGPDRPEADWRQGRWIESRGCFFMRFDSRAVGAPARRQRAGVALGRRGPGGAGAACCCSTARSGGWSRDRRGLGLLGLRLVAASVLVLALFEPIASRAWRESVRGRVLVAVDDSESMTTVDPKRPTDERKALATSSGDRVEGLTRRDIARRLIDGPELAAGPALDRPRRPLDPLRPRRLARSPLCSTSPRPSASLPEPTTPPDRPPTGRPLWPRRSSFPTTPRWSAWSC